MTEPASPDHVTIEIDGFPVQARRHEPLLDVARRLDIPIPSLCHHAALEPLGACRLCVVEHLDRGRTRFVASCTFPVEDGMVFRTDSEALGRHRRMIAELLLARCPDVPALRELARRLGVPEPRFSLADDTCILCGLCTRVCEAYATSAISLTQRGDRKEVGFIGDGPPPGCVGCGGCALVCPTGHITATRGPGTTRIWGRDFPLATCVVDPALCVACGACEEACPFSVPRVVLRKDGSAAAEIRVDACRGCGVCVAACPSGAISAPRARREVPAPDGARLLVIGCPRSALLDPAAPALPAGTRVLELPCAGGVGPGMLLSALALGYEGVLVLGRHQQTCRLDGAEDHVREVVARVERLADALGLGPGRVRFTEPMPGREGPAAAVRDTLEDLAALPVSVTQLPRERAPKGETRPPETPYPPTPLPARKGGPEQNGPPPSLAGKGVGGDGGNLAPAETAPAETAGDALAHAVELVFWMAKSGGREGLLPALDLLFEEWLAPAPFSERVAAAPRTAEEALGLLGGMLPGRRGAWRRSER